MGRVRGGVGLVVGRGRLMGRGRGGAGLVGSGRAWQVDWERQGWGRTIGRGRGGTGLVGRSRGGAGLVGMVRGSGGGAAVLFLFAALRGLLFCCPETSLLSPVSQVSLPTTPTKKLTCRVKPCP